MFFAKAGEYEPCGIFTVQHFELIFITILDINDISRHINTNYT